LGGQSGTPGVFDRLSECRPERKTCRVLGNENAGRPFADFSENSEKSGADREAAKGAAAEIGRKRAVKRNDGDMIGYFNDKLPEEDKIQFTCVEIEKERGVDILLKKNGISTVFPYPACMYFPLFFSI